MCKCQGWPHPTTYIIDRKAVVRWKVTDLNYNIRPTNQTIREVPAKTEGASSGLE